MKPFRPAARRRPTRTPARTASGWTAAPHRSARSCVASCGPLPNVSEGRGAVRGHRDDAAEPADIEYFAYRGLERTHRERKAGALRRTRRQQEYAQTGARDIIEPGTIDDHAGGRRSPAPQHPPHPPFKTPPPPQNPPPPPPPPPPH